MVLQRNVQGITFLFDAITNIEEVRQLILMFDCNSEERTPSRKGAQLADNRSSRETIARRMSVRFNNPKDEHHMWCSPQTEVDSNFRLCRQHVQRCERHLSVSHFRAFAAECCEAAARREGEWVLQSEHFGIEFKIADGECDGGVQVAVGVVGHGAVHEVVGVCFGGAQASGAEAAGLDHDADVFECVDFHLVQHTIVLMQK